MRRSLAAVVSLVVLAMTLGGCARQGASWAPAPREVGGLTTLASTVGAGEQAQLALHTEHGDVTFWGGVNLGATTPGHNPGELSVPREQYREWFPQMAEMGIRFVRVYTILPPFFYEEFSAYNQAHADEPLFLIQGVYLPDESYVDTGDLYAAKSTQAFAQELADASAAVSGDLVRDPKPGRASGTWTADVSPWLAAWIIGAELDPRAVLASDEKNATAPAATGRYFTAEPDATPTERWLAMRMDELAAAEAERGRSMPIAFVNWPTTDPLEHPVEPNPNEDLVTIDANRIRPTEAWPGGSFASYHAYPYYPDFLRFEPDLQRPRADGEVDAYLTYLDQLKAHHLRAGLPTMVTEFGVPASLGSAHYGTNGRDQGDHTEAEAMAMDAQMLRGIKSAGLSGALLFIWADEWFKFTWNTAPRFSVADSERRALWHDPLTNEQWFGIIATDPVATGWRTPFESGEGPVRSVSFDTDASYAFVAIEFAEPPSVPFTLGFDIVTGGRPMPGSSGDGVEDVAVVVDPAAGTANAYIRSELDPTRLDGLDPASLPADDLPGWRLQRMSANRAVGSIAGLPARDAEFVEVGRLQRGVWDPTSNEYDSRATWWLEGNRFVLRMPWSMLAMGDPSSKIAVVPVDGRPTGEPVESIDVALDVGSGVIDLPSIEWEAWNQPQATWRVKQGAEQVAEAWREVSADQ